MQTSPTVRWLRTILSITPVLLVLLMVVFAGGTATYINKRLLSFGESNWSGYALLRQGAGERPSCDPEAIKKEIQTLEAEGGSNPKAPPSLEDLPKGALLLPSLPLRAQHTLLAEAAPPGEEAPAGLPEANKPATDVADAPKAPEASKPAADVADAPKAPEEAPVKVAAPIADDDLDDDDDDDDDFDDLLGDINLDDIKDANAAEEMDTEALLGKSKVSLGAVQNNLRECEERHALFLSKTKALDDPSIQRFIGFHAVLEDFIDNTSGQSSYAIVFLILFCAFSTTLLRAHISLRPVRNKTDDVISQGGQLVAHLLLIYSFYENWKIEASSGTVIENESIFFIWMGGLGILSVVNIVYLILPFEGDGKHNDEKVGPLKSLLALPLYVSMALLAGTFYLVLSADPQGLAVRVNKLTLSDNAALYIQVGLYVWTGMLLKQMRIARLILDLVKPWRFPAEILALVVVVMAAIPTAYSGASGIFVIAVGALVFHELRAAGARSSIALAATAMSGSLGVVLRPCLLVVIIAMLNKYVTTDELFGWGRWVFVLSASLFGFACVITAGSRFNREALDAEKDPSEESPEIPHKTWSTFQIFSGMAGASETLRRMAPAGEAVRGTLQRIPALFPYVLLGGFMIGFYSWGIGMPFDEYHAAIILPIVMIALVFMDRRLARRDFNKLPEAEKTPEALPKGGMKAIFAATNETTEHVGALLMLMGLSIALGDVIESAGLMEAFPHEMGSPIVAMMLFLVLLVFIGMIMDPYGAVILVNASVADIAFGNGIHPIHFWLVVLTAFELGYLTPPVALNHLLTRQVVGDEADIVDLPDDASFWRRHEKIMLPLTVMGATLLLVAFVPFAFY